MRIGSILVALALALLAANVACAGGDSDESGSRTVEVTGPALVMFYIDN
jgi:hypothetical protein